MAAQWAFRSCLKNAMMTMLNMSTSPLSINVVLNSSQSRIIAVHGLGASPEHTWTCKPSSKSKTSDSQKSVHLLKDLLMKDERFTDARILHFAYNSDWLVDACFETARDIGLRLIEALIEHRKTHPVSKRIFITIKKAANAIFSVCP